MTPVARLLIAARSSGSEGEEPQASAENFASS